MTSEENIRFPLEVLHLPAPEVTLRVEAAANLLKLSDQLLKRPWQLSGGQRQRAAMGRAIVRDPGLFLLDEPLSNLDALLRVEMRAEISALQRELGRTTVYVTHDGEEAMTMGHRVAVLRDGTLQQCGTPGELYSTPANAFVAGFVGNPQMNFVPGQVWFDGVWQVGFGSVYLVLPDTTVARHPFLARHEGEAVIVGFRPETGVVDPTASETEAMDVEVTGIQQLGKETRVLFTAPRHGIGAGEIPGLDRVTHKVGRPGELMVTLSPPEPLVYGQSLRIRVDPASLHLFDALGRAL